MNILHVIASANPKGGGPIEGVIQLNQALKRCGHLTEVASLDAPGRPWISRTPLRVHPLGPSVSHYRYSRRLIPWLRQHQGRYDVVIINGIWQFHSFGTWLALRGVGKPYLLYTHGMLDPWFKRAYPLKHLKKFVYWTGAEHRVLRDAAAVCFTCEEERVQARRSFRRYECNEVVVTYGTARPGGEPDAQRAALHARYPELRSKRLFLFLSRIHEKKGCDLLIEAFARVAGRDPALHLVMAGPDQNGLRAPLTRQAERLGIADRITWTGMLSADLKWGAFHAAEAFILPSHQENFGIAAAEALACGLPVLISNKVNIWREIEADGAGLVADDTRDGTTQLLRRWLALPRGERQRMRHIAEQSFLRRFEIGQAAKSLLDVCSSVGAKA